MRCKTIARLHSPHGCRRLYNARNCITASLSQLRAHCSGHTATTYYSSGHTRRAVAKFDREAPKLTPKHLSFLVRIIRQRKHTPLANQKGGHCDFVTTPGSLYDQPWSKERARAGLVRQKTDPKDPVPNFLTRGGLRVRRYSTSPLAFCLHRSG
jgi:hypothetical protein